MKARRFELRLKGISPLVMNSNGAMLQDDLDKGRDPFAYEQAHIDEKLYLNAEGGLVIPARAIKKTLINGCRFVTTKPKGASFKTFGPLLEGAMLVEDDAVVDVPRERVVPWIAIVNLNPSKGPNGGKGPRCRPLIPLPWAARTTVSVLDDAITAEALEEIAQAAGLKVGFLDARKIDMGRAEITVEAR